MAPAAAGLCRNRAHGRSGPGATRKLDVRRRLRLHWLPAPEPGLVGALPGLPILVVQTAQHPRRAGVGGHAFLFLAQRADSLSGRAPMAANFDAVLTKPHKIAYSWAKIAVLITVINI